MCIALTGVERYARLQQYDDILHLRQVLEFLLLHTSRIHGFLLPLLS